jgi:hypothetical protein
MVTPAASFTTDRASANQARALRDLQETLNRHPRARVYARLARMPRQRVVRDSTPSRPRYGIVAVRSPSDARPRAQPRITDQVIRRRFRLSWLDG